MFLGTVSSINLMLLQDHYHRIQLLTVYLEKQERLSTSWQPCSILKVVDCNCTEGEARVEGEVKVVVNVHAKVKGKD